MAMKNTDSNVWRSKGGKRAQEKNRDRNVLVIQSEESRDTVPVDEMRNKEENMLFTVMNTTGRKSKKIVI